MSMSNSEKAVLARVLLSQAGNIVEFRTDMLESYPELQHVTTKDIALQLTTWLQRLPGESWDTRLPNPVAIAEGKKGYGK